METARRYVFPIIWMVLFALIAAALVRMAFFPATAADGASGDGISPTAAYDEYALVPATPADITSTLELPATVKPDATTPVLSSAAGEITKVSKHNGDPVALGDVILEVRAEDAKAIAAAEAKAQADADAWNLTHPDKPAQAPKAVATKYQYFEVTSTGSGTMTEMKLLEKQQVSIGDTIGQLSPGTYAIVADLTPEQQLRLIDVPLSATVELPTTPDPVPCEAPAITELSADEADAQQPSTSTDPMTGMPVSSSGPAASLRCPVPAGTKIVPGLSVEVTVGLGTASGVLTLPITAVEGKLGSGTVYTMDEATGEPTPVPVTLGLRDDSVVEITGGLNEGDMVLQFVPGVENPEAGMGGMGPW